MTAGWRESAVGTLQQLLPIIRREWGLVGDVDAVPVQTGLNNPTFRIRVGGRHFAGRLYENLDVSAIQREQALLKLLDGAGLSFRVPVPVSGRDGIKLASTPNGTFALFPWLDGQHPDPQNPQHLRSVGAAVAELDATFLRLDPLLTSMPGPVAPVHGDLTHIHPAVTDVRTLADQLSRDRPLQGCTSELTWLAAAIAACSATVPRLYRNLPVQWIHQDMALSNVLQVDGQVTGMLDFEFSDRDLRALDLVAMLTNIVSDFGEASGWRRVEALCSGYCSGVQLTQPEVEALPDLMHLRYVVSNIHGIGRWLAGLNPTEEVVRRLQNGAACDVAIQREAHRLRELLHDLNG